MSLNLDAIRERADVYAFARAENGAYNCAVTGSESADDVPGLLAEVERLRAQVAAAYAYAAQMGNYCSPHGVASRYAQELRAALNNAKEA